MGKVPSAEQGANAAAEEYAVGEGCLRAYHAPEEILERARQLNSPPDLHGLAQSLDGLWMASGGPFYASRWLRSEYDQKPGTTLVELISEPGGTGTLQGLVEEQIRKLHHSRLYGR